MINRLILHLLTGLFIAPCFASNPGSGKPDPFCRARMYSEEAIREAVPDYPNYFQTLSWVMGSNIVPYSTVENGVETYYIIDAENRSITRLFDKNEYIELVRPFTDELNDGKVRFNITRHLNGNELLCNSQSRELVLDIGTRQFREPQPDTVKETCPISGGMSQTPWKQYTRDSMFSIYAEGHDLYLIREGLTGSDSLVRLSTDGEKYYTFASGRMRRAEGPDIWSGQWIGDSHIGYILRSDSRKVGTLTLVNSIADTAPQPVEYKYELAGAAEVKQYELWLVYADSAKMVKADIDKFPDQEVKLVYSNRDGADPWIYFTRSNRSLDTLELCRLSPLTGRVDLLITEASEPIVNELMHHCTITDSGREIIWWSERTGRGSLYLYDGDGNYKNRITCDEFIAGNIVHLDTGERWMIVEGYGYGEGNPYYKKFFRVNLDGTGLTVLTPAEGDHFISLSLDKRYILDRWSTVEQTASHQVRDINGTLIAVIPPADDSALTAYGWSRPKIEKVKAADDRTDLWGIIYTPSDMEPGKKYPVICSVYPGPQTDMIPLHFGIDHGHNGSLAQMGFIVAQFGYRGSSPLRGRDFYTHGHLNLRDYALEDCRYVVEQLAEKYPYIDLDRVGICGHSGGGFMSAAAILTYPDFFKVAFSASGNHDNNMYGKFWTEPYHGFERVVSTGQDGRQLVEYRTQVPTTIALAGNLKGRLYLVTGEIDDNVHPAHTMRLANALIRNNKRFDMLVIPGRNHALDGDSYYVNLIRHYFEEHLKKPGNYNADMSGGDQME